MSYKCLTRNNAKIKDRVVLVNPNHNYIIGRMNPVIYSKYECYGTIVSIKSRIFVVWDNGLRNGYADNELILIRYRKDMRWNNELKQTIETENGKYVSIW